MSSAYTASDSLRKQRNGYTQRKFSPIDSGLCSISYMISSLNISFQLIQNEVEAFKNDLEKLQSSVKSSADFVGHVCLSQKEKEERSELIKV